MQPYLNKEQILFYQDNGYLIIKDYLSSTEIEQLQVATRDIIQQFDPQGLKIFTTEQQEHHMDHYFLESGDKVHCFLEEAAVGTDGLKVPKALAINKIGHAMHDRIPAFESIAYSKKLLAIAQGLGLQKASIVQSQYIFKQPNIGAKVSWHTDSTFIYTQPLSCLGVWIAMEDAREDNGCLLAIPGSHKLPLKERFIRNKMNTGTEFVSLKAESEHWNIEQAVALPVQKGDMILLHGQLVHASKANQSPSSRHAFVLHLVDLSCEWLADNWLQRPKNFPFRLLENVLCQRFN